MASKSALLMGATGLVGKALLQILEEENRYEKIIVVTRKSLKSTDRRIHQLIITDFSKLDMYSEELEANDYYCVIGSSLKRAGSEDAFRRANIGYPLNLARIARDYHGLNHFLTISAFGADSESPIIYTMVKGELENKLIELELPSLHIFQPSLIVGKRKELRLSELISRIGSALLSFFIISKDRKLNTVKDLELARAMFNIAGSSFKGVDRYTPKQIKKLANDESSHTESKQSIS